MGSWIAGFALESALGATGPVLVGTGVAALYFLPLAILLRKERAAVKRRDDAAESREAAAVVAN